MEDSQEEVNFFIEDIDGMIKNLDFDEDLFSKKNLD